MSLKMTVCSKCHTPFEYGPAVTQIDFPEDYDPIIALVEHRLNVFECPECHYKFFDADFIVLLGPQGEVILYTKVDEIRIAYEKETTDMGSPIFTTPDYTAFHQALLGWLTPCIEDFPGSLDILLHGNPKELACPLDPLSLRLLLSAQNGFISLQPSQMDSPIDVAALFPEVMRKCILWIYNQGALNERVLAFAGEIGTRIPADCLTQPVLDWFVSCSQYPPDAAIGAFEREWGIEFMVAVLHAHCGKENPLQVKFCRLIDLAWDIGRPGEGGISLFVYLNKELGQRLLRFDILFNICLEKLGAPEMKDNMDHLQKGRLLMDYYGWAKEYDQMVSSRVMVQFSDNAPIGAVVDNLMNDTIKKFHFSPDGRSAPDIAFRITELIKVFLNSNKTELCKLLISRSAQYAESAGDHITCILICLQGAKEFNKISEIGLAADLMAKINTDLKPWYGLLNPRQKTDVLFETANSARYLADFQASLRALDEAEALTPPLDEADRTIADSIIKRNRALCYRDMGEYAKALPLMQARLAENPGDFQTVLNIVMLYIRLNDYNKAIACLQPFGTQRTLSIPDELSYYLVSAWLNNSRGDGDTARLYISKAFKNYARYNLMEQCQFINVLLFGSISTAGIPGLDIVELATALIRAGNEKGEVQNLFITSSFLFLARLLKDHNRPLATALVASNPRLLTVKTSWEFYHIIAWYYLETGDHNQAAAAIDRFMRSVNETIPTSDNISFTIGWFSDKDEVQQHVMTMAKKLFDLRAIPIFTFLEIIEFNYGKEITSRLLKTGSFPPIQQTLEIISANFPRTEIFVLFEIDQGVYFVNISTSQTRIIVSQEQLCTNEEAARIRQQAINAYKHASPSLALLKYTDKQLAGMQGLFDKMGGIFRQWIGQDTDKVYFVAGKALSNLPLHLIPLEQSTLIEKLPVGYMNNLTSLALVTKARTTIGSATIVTVTKQQESEAYTQAAFDTSHTLEDRFKTLGIEVSLLSQEQGTIDHVRTSLGTSDETIFLCHGSGGTADQGAGICLAYKAQLPTEFLSLKSSLQKEFLLTWQDFENIRMPQLLISTACSSGTTRFGRGGVQIGFEQTVFAQGCATLISPLWDVYQLSSLYWLERFFENRAQNPTLDLIDSYRAACLATKEKYPHPFFWAPFIFKGI